MSGHLLIFCHWSSVMSDHTHNWSDIVVTLTVHQTYSIQLNPLGTLLILWSDNMSDHTALLSDKLDIWPGKCWMTDCHNCRCPQEDMYINQLSIFKAAVVRLCKCPWKYKGQVLYPHAVNIEMFAVLKFCSFQEYREVFPWIFSCG